MSYFEHSTLQDLARALVISYAAGLNLYAAVAMLGFGQRFELLQNFPETLTFCASEWTLFFGSSLCCVEFFTTLMPGVARAWETVHSLIRPPASAVLAACTVWHHDPSVVLIAGLLGGLLGITTHTTKLGLQYASDALSQIRINTWEYAIELCVVVGIIVASNQYPYIALVCGIVLLLLIIATIPVIRQTLMQVFTGRWNATCGLTQDPRNK